MFRAALVLVGITGLLAVGPSMVGHSVEGAGQKPNAPAGLFKVSGDVTYCLGTNHFSINNVTIAITGPPNDSPVTNPAGHYQSIDLQTAMTYTLVPSRTEAPLPPASTGFNVLDVIRLRQIILNNEEPTLPACEKAAAEVNGTAPINVLDVIAERQFILGTAAGNIGKWAFAPPSDVLLSPTGPETRNFGAVRVGDLNGDWPGPGTGPAGQSIPAASAASSTKQASAAGVQAAPNAPTAVTSVSLPVASVAVATAPPGSTPITNFGLPVLVSNTTGNRITGFQCDFVLNNTTVADVGATIAELAGLTVKTSWSISGSVISTVGSSKTIRILADSNGAVANEIDSGSGVLFRLNFVRVSSTPGATTNLTWVPGSFIFSSNLPAMFVIPDNLTNGSITISTTPTAVTLASFKASGYDNGVHLNWNTGFEAENLGFNIYREVAGKRTLVTPDIIAGSALMTGAATRLEAGQSYGWWDKSAGDQQDVRYLLEEIDIDGSRIMHGPFDVNRTGGQPPRESQAELLSQLGRGEPRTRQLPLEPRRPELSALSVSPSATTPRLASMRAVKLTIKEEGWYRVSQQELAVAGLDLNADPRRLQLYVDGVEQPMLVTGDGAIEFFGTGQDSLSTNARVYWLVNGDRPGKRIEVAGGDGRGGGVTGFPYTVERRDRTIYFSSLRNGDTENFFGQVITSKGVDQTVAVSQLDSKSGGSAQIEIALQGAIDLDGSTDHQVRVLLNGAELGRMSFDGLSRKVEKFVIGHGQLKDGDNVFTLIGEASNRDISLVDYIRVTYPRAYISDQDSLRVTASGAQTIEGFSNAAIRVFDISDPASVVEVTGTVERRGETYAVGVALPGQGTRTLLALTDARIKRPASISANQASNLRTRKNKATFVIIARREFFPALEPLKSLRESQGLKVALVDVEDIFDEFSDGERTPQAVKDFLSFATSTWKKKPRFVLFAGHASLDPKNHLGFGDSDLVPTKLIDTELMETASDNWFVDFDGDGLSELAVGRLPFRTANEAETMVSKIVSYESSSVSNEVLFVADSNDGFDFESASAQLRGLLPSSLKSSQLNRGRLDPDTAKAELVEAINRGQKIVNYMGHGSVNLWKGNLLTNDDALSLTNTRLPLFVMMTCLNGYFHDAALDSLGESLLRAERGGAVAVWTSSGMTSPNSQEAANRELYRLLFVQGQKLTLGEAVTRAKASAQDSDVRSTWILLGDPTMRIK